MNSVISFTSEKSLLETWNSVKSCDVVISDAHVVLQIHDGMVAY